jgi:hypothetical protein
MKPTPPLVRAGGGSPEKERGRTAQYRLRVPIHLRGLLATLRGLSLADGSVLPRRPVNICQPKSPHDYLFNVTISLSVTWQLSSRFGRQNRSLLLQAFMGAVP